MTPTAYLIIGISLALNIFFIYERIDTWLDNWEEENVVVQEGKIYFGEPLFSEDFELQSYESTRFTLEQEGIDIINNAREFHSSPALIKGDAYNEYVCAGYIFELSRKLWDPSAPYLIGMMEQNTKTVADAWQLPYSYEYVGGKILADFTGDFSVDDKDYWDVIDGEKLKDFFDITFSEDALFGDIGFFYKNTQFTQDLKTYENANSHIVKNIGTSQFQRKIDNPEGNSHEQIVSRALSCDSEVFAKIKNLLGNYEVSYNDQRIVWSEDNFYFLGDDLSIGEKVVFTDMSNIEFQDITLMHFFEGAKVESLFEMTCQGDFFPVNIMQINPRFIEKM